MKTVNLLELEVKDLGGENAISAIAVGRGIGESIYSGMSGLAWLNVAQAFHGLKPIDLSTTEIATLIKFVKSDNCGLFLMVKVPLIAYLENLIS